MMPKRLLAIAVFGVLAVGLAGCGTDEPDDVAGDASPSMATSDTPTTAPSTAPTTGAAAVTDGCPPDVNLMYERLKENRAMVGSMPPSLSGLEEPTCAEGWAVSRTVVKDADSALVLFKHEPDTGRWVPVAFGTDGVCDQSDVPETIQAKLGPGC